MSKVRAFGVAIAAAGMVLAGSGLAVAATIPLEQGVTPVVAPGEPDPSGGTGSSSALTKIVEALVTGSKGVDKPAPTT